jgi:hypothetical protein
MRRGGASDGTSRATQGPGLPRPGPCADTTSCYAWSSITLKEPGGFAGMGFSHSQPFPFLSAANPGSPYREARTREYESVQEPPLVAAAVGAFIAATPRTVVNDTSRQTMRRFNRDTS